MNKYILVGLVVAVPAIIFILQSLDSANAQKTPSVTEAIEQNYRKEITYQSIVENVTYVGTMYESPTTVVIYGDLIVPEGREQEKISVPNRYLWQAMDLVKDKFGYHLQQLITSGQGSVANPTTIYLLMVK